VDEIARSLAYTPPALAPGWPKEISMKQFLIPTLIGAPLLLAVSLSILPASRSSSFASDLRSQPAATVPTTPRAGAARIAPVSEEKPMHSSRYAFPFPVDEMVFGNGLRAYVVHYDSPGLVAYYSVVRTGSRNEVEPGKSGFAHFFEHMMFRGTEKFSQEAYNGVIKEMGADSNAYTSDDLTVYHILAAKTALPKIVEIEADRFQNLKYAEPDFEKEARAVLGEYNKGASNPMQKIYEALYDNAFTKHTYKHTTIGFLKDIEAMPKQFAYSRQFFDRYYRPDNVTLLIVGDVDTQATWKMIDLHYGKWKGGSPRPAVPTEPIQPAEKRTALGWTGATLPMLMMGFHTPGFSTRDVDLPALDVLAELMFAERAPLYKKLVIAEQKVETLGGSNDAHVDPNLFTVLARIKKPADLAAVEHAITAEFERIARDGVDDKTLADVLSHVKYAFAGQLATADKTANVAAQFVALTGHLDAINAYFLLYDRVTPADVKRVARKYFQATNRTVVSLKADK
jgi:zinc protease